MERYKKRFGFYPDAVLADQIYRTRENRKFCKELKIRISGPPLGRPPTANVEENREKKKKASEDYRKRVEVEGKFGEAKRAYDLDSVMTKLSRTSESFIALVFLTMNLEKKLRFLLHQLFLRLWGSSVVLKTCDFAFFSKP